jgi:hypothetical protein
MLKLLQNITLTLSLSISSATAGILDVDVLNNSQLDGYTLDVDGYNLDWLDFSVNNGLTYNQAIQFNDLLAGDWRVASADEVAFLWDHLFRQNSDTQTLLIPVAPQFFAASLDPGSIHKSTWESYVDIMGFVNHTNGEHALGWYETNSLGLNTATVSITNTHDQAVLSNLQQSNTYRLFSPSPIRSTFMVRERSVPEPSTLVILLMALTWFGFGSRFRSNGRSGFEPGSSPTC